MRSVLSQVKCHPGFSQLNLTAILENPHELGVSAVRRIVESDIDPTSDSLAELCTILLVAPMLSGQVPITFLRRCLEQFALRPALWQSLALLMLHGDDADRVVLWLQQHWSEEFADSDELLLQHLCHWFPEKIQTLPQAAKRRRSPITLSLSECMSDRNTVYEARTDNLLAKHFRNSPRILVVQNIADNQGDEILRVHLILQALLDGFPQLEVTLLTNRWYLYDHPRVQTRSIDDTEFLKQSLLQQWDGVIVFFEPYLSTNSYNLAAQQLLQKHIEANTPPLFMWARKRDNYFSFESVKINGEECATIFGINKRLIPLNYDPTMRLIECLRLPMRSAEQIPLAGSVAACQIPRAISEEWHSVKESFEQIGRESVALINIFGGSGPLKGYTETSFVQLAPAMKSLVDEGYGLLIVSNGESWGNQEKIQEVLSHLDINTRKHTIALPDMPNAQENMRRIKHFVALSDLTVTIEGWMMHLAYALGKPFRVLVASYSGPWEWFPIACSSNQKRWIPASNRKLRNELAINQSGEIPQLHFPDKSLLQAAFNVWSQLDVEDVDAVFSYWEKSKDREIRKWVVSARVETNFSRYQAKVIKALEDPDHLVRGTAATALLDSGIDLTSDLGQEWRTTLTAYQLLIKYQFPKVKELGAPALRALRACLTSEEQHLSRDAQITIRSMIQEISD